jgi:tetratricopeptide (TPR) repeat protein
VDPLSRIEEYIRKGDFRRARNELTGLVKASPGRADLLLQLARVEQKLNNLAVALDLRQRALATNDRDGEVLCALGGVHLARADYDSAQTSFEKALALSEDTSTYPLLNVLTLRARNASVADLALEFEQRLAKGLAACREQIERGHNIPWACFDAAQIEFFRGDYGACRDFLRDGALLAGGSWQLDTAATSYRILRRAHEGAVRNYADEMVAWLESLSTEYQFAQSRRCFVVMPFGEKTSTDGAKVDFDDVYDKFIRQIVEDEQLTCVRCDQVDEAGAIHQKMFKLLWDAEVALIDISSLNPNVFYEMGVRHALRRDSTIIIRSRGTVVPFNVAGLNVVEYDGVNYAADSDAKARIRAMLRTALEAGGCDSPVQQALALRITDTPRVISKHSRYEYPVLGLHADRSPMVGIATGDIRAIKGIDVWLNSENTNMQMARFHDFSVSSVVRFEGAKKSPIGHVIEDTIQSELTHLMAGERIVEHGTVLATSSGELQRRNGVKLLLHAAAVEGRVGGGYRPVQDIEHCVSNALARMDEEAITQKLELRSLLTPLLGIGMAQGEYRPLLERQVRAVVKYLQEHSQTCVERIYFLAWSEQELALCQAVFRSIDDLGQPQRRA